MRTYLPIALIATLLAFSLAVPAAPERVYEDYVPNSEIDKAIAMTRQEDDQGVDQTPAALAIFARIAAENRGKTLGAVALLQQAKYTSADLALPLYQDVITTYAGSRYEVIAQNQIADIQTHGYRNYARALERVAQRYGGPILAQISQSDPSRASTQVLRLPREYRRGLLYTYSSLEGALYGDKAYAEAASVAQFTRDTFFQLIEDDQFGYDVLTRTAMADLGTWPGIGGPAIDPQIRLLNPERVCGKKPKLVFDLYTAPYPAPMVDLSTFKVSLDGKDFRPNLVASSRIKHYRRGPKDFFFDERIRLNGRPSQPLGKGPHTLEVWVKCRNYDMKGGTGPGYTHKFFTFTVGRDRDDDEDEREGYCWERD